MKKTLLILFFLVGGALLLAACAPFWQGGGPSPAWGPFGFGGNFSSNGERIYFTATNQDGERIRYSGGPAFGGMMGASLACVSCHGPDGRGGQRMMHMQVIDAPDIRYKALAAEEGEHGEEGHGGEGEYDLETFRLAVVEGKHPNGDPLDGVMPRWQISDQDLADLFAFLKTLP